MDGRECKRLCIIKTNTYQLFEKYVKIFVDFWFLMSIMKVGLCFNVCGGSRFMLDENEKRLVIESVPFIKTYVWKTYPIQRTSKETIDDLISESYSIIIEKIHTYDSNKSKLGTWIYSILGIYLRNYFKKTYIKEPLEYCCIDDENKELSNSDDFKNRRIFNECFTTKDDFDLDIDLQILRKTIDSLPVKKKQIMDLFLDGYTGTEIAEKLNYTDRRAVNYNKLEAIEVIKRKLGVRSK